MKTKYPDYRADQNRRLDRVLATALRHRDPSRHVHEASTAALRELGHRRLLAPVTRVEKTLTAGDYTLIAWVSDSKGRPLGRNEWNFRVEEAPAEKPAIEITTEKRSQDGRSQQKRRLEKRPAR
jgi:hypothetical protein